MQALHTLITAGSLQGGSWLLHIADTKGPKVSCNHQRIHTRQIQKTLKVMGCLAKCTSSSLDRQIQTPHPCFPWPPKIISLLSVGLAVMIVYIDSDVPLGEELFGVNGSWQQHRAGGWCPVTRPHTRVINWLQSPSAALTVMCTWTKYNAVLQSLPPDRAWARAEIQMGFKEGN